MTNQQATVQHSTSEIYDRQIRLWGAEAQNKISSAKILYVYCTQLSLEVLKNLALAGVQPAICDGRSVGALNMTASFFLGPDRAGGLEKAHSVAEALQGPVHELNPLLEKCEIFEHTNLAAVEDEFFGKFDVIICSPRLCGMEETKRMARLVTRAGGCCYAADAFGYYAVAALDLGENHKYRREMGKDKLSDWMTNDRYSPMDMIFSDSLPLSELTDRWNKAGPPKIWALYRSFLAFYESNDKSWPSLSENSKSKYAEATVKWLSESQGLPGDYLGTTEDLMNFASIAGTELPPVCAVLGGVLGNEVIKALSTKGEPANNILLFDGNDGSCVSFCVKKK